MSASPVLTAAGNEVCERRHPALLCMPPQHLRDKQTRVSGHAGAFTPAVIFRRFYIVMLVKVCVYEKNKKNKQARKHRSRASLLCIRWERQT